ncbi:MAG: hypothetical protein AAGI15_09745 [Pseudomonadota bacterium]
MDSDVTEKDTNVPDRWPYLPDRRSGADRRDPARQQGTARFLSLYWAYRGDRRRQERRRGWAFLLQPKR